MVVVVVVVEEEEKKERKDVSPSLLPSLPRRHLDLWVWV
jgi:hypothetical protein